MSEQECVMSDAQDRGWREHVARCMRRGLCPDSGLTVGACRAWLCDCVSDNLLTPG